MGAVLLILGAAVVVLAVFAYRGSRGARIALTVLGALHVLGTSATVFTGAPEGLVSVLYVGVAVTLLWVGRANAWYTARKAARAIR